MFCLLNTEVKKPAGTAEEVERHFGCESSRLIMVNKVLWKWSLLIWCLNFLSVVMWECLLQVGDRPFTDIVYGNRNGFLTILTAPLSLAEEPFIVNQVRFPFLLIVTSHIFLV